MDGEEARLPGLPSSSSDTSTSEMLPHKGPCSAEAAATAEVAVAVAAAATGVVTCDISGADDDDDDDVDDDNDDEEDPSTAALGPPDPSGSSTFPVGPAEPKLSKEARVSAGVGQPARKGSEPNSAPIPTLWCWGLEVDRALNGSWECREAGAGVGAGVGGAVNWVWTP